MDNIDPATKQYLIFSLIVSMILSAIINFALIEVLSHSFLYGFPVSLTDTTGLGNFLARVINTAVQGLILLPLVYYGFRYWITRRR